MVCHALLQGNLLAQGWNPCFLCLLHWQAELFIMSATQEAIRCDPKFQWSETKNHSSHSCGVSSLADVGVLLLIVTWAQADGAPPWTQLTKQIQWHVSHPWLLELLADRVHSTSPPSLLALTSEGAAKCRSALYQEGATRIFATREILLIHGVLLSLLKGIAPATSLPSY